MTVTTDDHLIVEGKSKSGGRSGEFKREFTLPHNVDHKTLKATLEEQMLTLVAKLKSGNEASSVSTNTSSGPKPKVGQIKENKTDSAVLYELYLGDEFKEGEVVLELTSHNNLNIKVSKNGWDAFGDFGVELKRQMKLPSNASAKDIEQSFDSRNATLRIKVPLK
jgi:HSP20 family molecular chaperone IbpA